MLWADDGVLSPPSASCPHPLGALPNDCVLPAADSPRKVAGHSKSWLSRRGESAVARGGRMTARSPHWVAGRSRSWRSRRAASAASATAATCSPPSTATRSISSPPIRARTSVRLPRKTQQPLCLGHRIEGFGQGKLIRLFTTYTRECPGLSSTHFHGLGLRAYSLGPRQHDRQARHLNVPSASSVVHAPPHPSHATRAYALGERGRFSVRTESAHAWPGQACPPILMNLASRWDMYRRWGV